MERSAPGADVAARKLGLDKSNTFNIIDISIDFDSFGIIHILINAVEFAKAIADETRQQIMQLCCCHELCVSDIVQQIGLSQPTISHHLAILRDAGLVHAERRGREVFYTLNQARITHCCGQLLLTFAPEEDVTKTVAQELHRA